MKAFHLCSLLLVFVLSLTPLAQTVLSPAQIAKKASSAVVVIKGMTAEGNAFGTGFILSPDGKVATALHVIEGLKSGGVQLASGERFDSFTVLAFDQRKDLAIIKIAGFDLPAIDLGNSNQISPGDQVVLIGSPEGLHGSVTTGVVSAVRELEGFKVIQTDAAANPGNSGGPLLNSFGQAIGVLDFKLRGTENLNFAVPINYIRGMLGEVKSPMTLAELATRVESSPDVVTHTEGPSAASYLSLGVKNINEGRREEAISALQTTCSLRSAEGCFALGGVCFAVGRYQEALAGFQEAAKLEPGNASNHYFSGICLGQLRRFDEAVTALRQAIRLKPDDAKQHYYLGRFLTAGRSYLDAVFSIQTGSAA